MLGGASDFGTLIDSGTVIASTAVLEIANAMEAAGDDKRPWRFHKDCDRDGHASLLLLHYPLVMRAEGYAISKRVFGRDSPPAPCELTRLQYAHPREGGSKPKRK